jgi:hypothetical protein
MRLDWLLFGNGWGMASPYFDDAFYWLADRRFERSKRGRHSRFYRLIGGLGAQLTSYEWRAPPAGTRRRLAGYEFVVFQTHRKGLRVECSWATVSAHTVEDVRKVCDAVKAWGHGL